MSEGLQATATAIGRLPRRVCRHDPCWCGLDQRIVAQVEGALPWTPEGEARFFAARAAERERRAQLEREAEVRRAEYAARATARKAEKAKQ